MHSTVVLGSLAEQTACDYLKAQGLTFVDSNYRIKGGEIDLIMRDKEFLVFIEVKMRQQASHGDAIEMITPKKIKCIIRTAQHYLIEHELTDKIHGRFDVIGINKNKAEITWIQNAFDVKY